MPGSTRSPRPTIGSGRIAASLGVLVAISFMLFASGASAQENNPPAADAPASAPAPRPGVNRGTVLQLLLRANPMLWPLGVCSIFTLGISLERLLALRRKRVIPTEFVDRFLERLAAGKLDRDRALELCRANDSPAARVFAQVVKAWGQPGATIRQNLSFDAAGEVVEMKRNLRVLSGLATLGPLLGLLGTVVGIIQSFDALGGRIGPARGEALAQGISLALVATAAGLAIAIFAVTAFYYLMNRVDVLVRELDERTRQAIELVSAEALRPANLDRRHAPTVPGDPLRQETRVY
jgi:biopolymer transport protein ExbB